MVKAGDWTPTEHFNERLDQRRIDLHQVLEAIRNGDIVEEFPKRSPNPECMIRGTTHRDLAGFEFDFPLYVQCGVGEVVFLITADWNPPRELGQKGQRRRGR